MRFFDSFNKIQLIDKNQYTVTLYNPKKISKIFYNKGRICNVDLYCLLKSRFGEPNGFLSFLRGDHSDNFIHWHFSLHIDGIYIDIKNSTRFLEFYVFSENLSALDQFDEKDFFESLQSLIESKKHDIIQVKSQLEYWQVFLNTYKRLVSTMDHFYKAYCSISLKDPILLDSPVVTKKEYKTYMRQMGKFLSGVMAKKNYGIVLKMLYPVLGESLVNMIIFILAKDEIKSDKRLLENTFRTQIDIRIKTLHLTCRGIKTPYNQDDIRFKDFLRLMNKRNDFLHGNILPANHTFDVVHFDGTIPLFDYEKDIAIEVARQNLFQVTENEINEDSDSIAKFKVYILENIEDSFRRRVEIILNKSDLGWDVKNKKIGVLFGDDSLQSFFISKKKSNRNKS